MAGADLRGIKLREANLRRINLSGADLRSMRVRGLDGEDAGYTRFADLTGANTRGMKLEEPTAA